MQMNRLQSLLGIALTLLLALIGKASAEEITSSIADEMACCDGDCDDYCGCDGCGAPYWFAGTEVTFLQADVVTGGNVNLSVDNTNTAGVDLRFHGAEGIEQFTYSPRIWIGRQISDRWAVAGRFWHLSSSAIDPASPPPGFVNGTTFATTNDKADSELYTIDLEAIRSTMIGRTKLDGSLGARHASFKADAELNSFGVPFTGTFINMLFETGSHFHGTGVTSSLTGRRQIGDLPLYAFLGGRGSVMTGHSFSMARVAGTVASSPSAPLVGAATVTRNNEDTSMYIAEFQAGLQWEPALEYLPANLFFRSAFEYQKWSVNGPPVGGVGFGGTINNATINSFAPANNGNADLFGFSFATGMTW